jgi:hypothetical protein
LLETRPEPFRAEGLFCATGKRGVPLLDGNWRMNHTVSMKFPVPNNPRAIAGSKHDHDAVFSMTPTIFILSFVFLLCNCVYTPSGNTNFNRDIEVAAASGAVSIDISGHISENIYLKNDRYYNKTKTNSSPAETLIPKTATPVVEQGKETIRKTIILYETEKFKYTLTTAEALIMSVRSIDSNDAKLIVFEHGRSKEYIIDGKNQLGRMISFKN